MSGAPPQGASAPAGPAARGAGVNIPGPQRHQSFASLYGDDTRYPIWEQSYASVLGVWEIIPGSISGTDLGQQLRTHQGTPPMTFLAVFGDGSGMGEIRVLHQPRYFSTPLGTTPTANLHDRMYAIYDDLGAGNFVPHVRFPSSYLDILRNLRVPTSNTFTQTIPFPDHFGPYPAPTAEVENVSVRKICWVPPRVASLVLSASSRRVVDVVQLLAANVSSFSPDGGWDKFAGSFFVWLRTAMTVDNQGNSLVCLPMPDQAPMSPDLIKFRWDAVTRDLPTLGDSAIQSGAEQISAAIGAGVSAYADAREEDKRRAERIEREKQGTVRKKFGHCLTSLLRLTHQSAPEDVPPAWHALAQQGAKRYRSTLQAEINSNSQRLMVNPPVISPHLSGILTDPTLWRTDTYDVDLHQGWTVWGVLAREQRGKSSESRRARAYDTAQLLGSTVSHTDVDKFLAVEDGCTVASPAHLIESMENNLVISHTMLGERHTVTKAFHDIIDWMKQHGSLLTEKWLNSAETIWWPTAVLFYFHKELSCWVNYQLATDDPVAPPNFMGWTHKLQIGDHWHRGLPAQLSTRQPDGLDDKSLMSAITDGTGLTDLSSTSGGGGGSGDGGNGGSGGDGRDWSKGTTMARGDAHTKLKEFKTHSVGYQDMLKAAKAANDPLPVDDHGVPFCLSYHLRGQCYDNCGRHVNRKNPKMVSNHRKLTDGEAERLAKWCKSHYK